jgi:hypothetical protein
MELIRKEVEEKMEKYGIKNVYRSVGRDYEELEMQASVDGVGLSEGLWHGVQMSVGAAMIDRSKTLLEWEGVRGAKVIYCADVVVFRSEEAFRRWESGEILVYFCGRDGLQIRENLVSVNNIKS